MDNPLAVWLIVAAAFGTACAAQTRGEDAQIIVEPVADQPKTSDVGRVRQSESSEPPLAPDTRNEGRDDTLDVALRRGAQRAARCADGIPGAPTGEGDVHVFVDGQKGKIADAIVGAPFARAAVERCIRSAFIGEIVPPFEGPPKEIAIKVKVAPR